MVVIVPVGVVIDEVVIVRPEATAAANDGGTGGKIFDDVDEAETGVEAGSETSDWLVFLISLVFPSLGEFKKIFH